MCAYLKQKIYTRLVKSLQTYQIEQKIYPDMTTTNF